jgi:hypothetical protein
LDPGGLVELQLSAFRLGLAWLEMTAGAATVIASRGLMLGQAMARPGGLAEPEFALMVTEKLAAVGEAAERASRHALRRRRRRRGDSAAAELAASVELARSCLAPFRRRVRANVRRLG